MASIRESQIIEKLNDKNFSNWKFKVEMMLMKEDLYEQITNDPPDPITDDWRKKDNKARALINLSINDDQIIHIKNLSSAKTTFDTLKRIHERSNLSSKLYLLRTLYNIKLKEGENMIAHITRILETVDRLKAIGEDISDSHVSALLLCSLPKSYDTLITALEARPEDELDSSFIRSKLTDEYNRRVDSDGAHENAAKAFQIKKKYAQNSYQNNNYKQGNNSRADNFRKESKFCTYCKKSNHTKFECYHLKNKGYQTQKNKRPENKSALCQEINPTPTLENVPNTKPSGTISDITSKLDEFAFVTEQVGKVKWIMDSGSSSHISKNKNLFSHMTNLNETNVIVANGNVLTAYGSGDIKLEFKTSNNKVNIITLRDVLYVPDIQTNLISVKKATESGCKVIFEDDKCKLMHRGKLCLEGYINNNLYEVAFHDPQSNNYVNIVENCVNENCVQLWHRRMGHRNYDSIQKMMANDSATGLKLHKCQHRIECEICAKCKLTNKPYPKQAQNRANKILDLVHSDLCGPIKTPTIGGKRYLMTFIDDYSRYTIVYLLENKNEVFNKLKEYVAMTQNKFGRTIGALRSDNGREYVNTETESYLKSLGIKHQRTVPYCAPQNGVAERKNRSLIEMTRCLLSEANLDHKFWGEAVNTANYLQNRLLTKPNEKTPFEYWEERKPDLSNLRLFGCKAYAYVDKQKRTKLDDTSQPGIFVGYDTNSKGYRIFTGGNKITISRTVKFMEDVTPNQNSNDEQNLTFGENNINRDYSKNEIELDLTLPTIEETPKPADTTAGEPRRSERSNKGVPPNRLIYYTQQDRAFEPKDWGELQNIKNPIDKQNWLNATKEEIDSLMENKTWKLVDPPPGKRVIGCKWTFKSKYNSEGKIEKYKARLVAKGFSQKYGEDYDETFAPVVTHTTIRALLATAAYKKLKVTHVDVKTAFLHGDLTEEVFMSQPEGYVTPGNEHKVCRLKKAIYGLKQAARAWQIKIAETLTKLYFVQSTADPCLYSKRTDQETIYIVVYVDDILIAGSENDIDRTVQELRNEFEIKNLGPVNYYLGINIRKTDDGFYAINQNIKIKEIINKFNLQEAKPCDTPMNAGYLNDDENHNYLQNNINYRQALGALLYVATISRPDILAAVNILSRKNENPRVKDWEEVKRIIRYLKTSENLELVLDPNPDAKLVCYTDADWGGDKSDRKSTSGNLLLLGKCPLSWISKKQTCVALSSAEAEYIAAANAAQEIQWTLNLLHDLDMQQNLPITLYEDNQSAIKMIQNPKYTSRTKHMDIKFHCIRDLKNKGIIDLQYCPTNQMIADCLTKPLPKPQFSKHRTHLQLLPQPRSGKTGE